ncbi:hypothetical protein [Bacillus haynesii]|uniref:hypothetical protein n=1 Tax=Bacillus haynesii TaxID=1925021 RepID=UPI0003ED9E12|nr:hypothetical protein [Bacillus haynesii]EWH20548.1 hypothetical protein M769_0119975 [Bacillus haynesii]
MDKTEEIELMNSHLNQLIKLKQSGYRCDQEIGKVLNKMHNYMGLNKSVVYIDTEVAKNVDISALKRNFSNSDFFKYKSYSDIDQELQRRFRNAVSNFVIVGDSDRGKGKTTLLLRLSQENDIPLIVGAHARMYVKLAKEKGIDCTIISAKENLRDRSFPNGAYIDCSVSREQLQQIKRQGIEIKGGFHHDDVLSSLV